MKFHPLLSLFILSFFLFSCNKKLKKAQETEPVYEVEIEEVDSHNQEEISEETPPIEEEEIEEEVVIEEVPVHLLASIKRTACFGKCPTYEVKIYSDGKMTYQGQSNVNLLGQYESIVPPGILDKLWAKANTIRYFDFAPAYPINGRKIPDLPLTITYLKSGDLENNIINNYQSPKALQDFEKLFDALILEVNWQKIEGGND